MIERDKIDAPNTQIHDHWPFMAWHRHINEKSGGVKLILMSSIFRVYILPFTLQ
jgi:hypothetical protein